MANEKEKIRFSIPEYKRFYNKEPEEGDLVFFHQTDNKLIFKYDETEVIEKIILKGRKEKKETTKLIRGRIKNFNNERGFGFVNSGKKDYFFYISVYREFYGNKEPEEREEVLFSTVINRKTNKIEIKSFHSNKPLQCDKSSFKNFIEIENDALYYIYSADNIHSNEVYKFDPKDLSQAISCYKDQKIHAKFRLVAIDSLIKFDYSDKYITQEILKNKKSGILNILLTEELRKGNQQKALEYEQILQNMNYKPTRLRKFDKLNSDFLINFSEKENIVCLNNNEYWDLSFDELPLIKELEVNEEYFLDMENPFLEIETNNYDEEWSIDLTNPVNVTPLTNYDEFINLEISK